MDNMDKYAIEVGRRIRDLRRAAHLSQEALAAAIGIKQAPLSNLENGKNLPSARVTLALANYFDISLDALMQGNVAAADGDVGILREEECVPYGYSVGRPLACEVRSEEPFTYEPFGKIFLNSADAEFWRATSREHIERFREVVPLIESIIRDYLALEDICKVPRYALVPLELGLSLDATGIERFASKVRTIMGVGEVVIFDLLELFENHGLRVVFVNLPKEAFSLSFYDVRNRNVFIIIDAQLNSEKKIFRLLYEFGSILIQRGIAVGGSEHSEAIGEDKLRRLFAANFLMPEAVVRQSVMQVGVARDKWTYELLLRLKHRFGVSAESFNYRLLELGLITKALQTQFRATIIGHYAAHNYAEPGDSRRILSPNGRLGDLLHVALHQHDYHNNEVIEIQRRLQAQGIVTL